VPNVWLPRCKDECLEIPGGHPNGIEDPKVREFASGAEPVHRVSAYTKDGRNFFDGQQRLEAGHRAPVRIVQH